MQSSKVFAGVTAHRRLVPLFTLLASLLYLLAAVSAWRALLRDPACDLKTPVTIAAAAIVLHGWDLSAILRNQADYALNIGDVLSIWGWVIAVTAFIAAVKQPLRGLPAVHYALVALAASFAALPRGYHESFAAGVAFTAHVILSMLATGWLSMAAICAVLLVMQGNRLKARQHNGWVRVLPPMDLLEKSLFTALTGGFIALTTALFTGLVFVYDLRAQHLTHKVGLSLLAWALFGALIVGRLRYGWRGRTAARFSVAGFLILALAYLGSKFVLEVLLHRHWG